MQFSGYQGLYAPQILSWLQHWHPNQLLFLSYEKLFSSQATPEETSLAISKMHAHFMSSELPLSAFQGNKYLYCRNTVLNLDLLFVLDEKLKFLHNSIGEKGPSSIPHANPTKGSHKLSLDDISCESFCQMNEFFAVSSGLTVAILDMIYGVAYSSVTTEFSTLIASPRSQSNNIKGSVCNCGSDVNVTFSSARDAGVSLSLKHMGANDTITSANTNITGLVQKIGTSPSTIDSSNPSSVHKEDTRLHSSIKIFALLLFGIAFASVIAKKYLS